MDTNLGAHKGYSPHLLTLRPDGSHKTLTVSLSHSLLKRLQQLHSSTSAAIFWTFGTTEELVGDTKLQIRERDFNNDVPWVFFHGHTAIAVIARSTNSFKFNVNFEVCAFTTDKSSLQPI